VICEICEGEGYVRGTDPQNPGALVMLPCLKMVVDVLGCGDSWSTPWIEDFREGGVFAGRAVNLIVAVPRGQTQ
jgi:hypothetical protein